MQGVHTCVLASICIDGNVCRTGQDRCSHIFDSHGEGASLLEAGLVSDGVGDCAAANAKAGSTSNRASDTVHAPVVAGRRCIPADGGGWSSGGRVDGDGIRAGDRGLARVLHSHSEGAGRFVTSIIGCSSSHLAKQNNYCSVVMLQHIQGLTVVVDPTAKLLPDALL